jgi:hypothetical protein
MKTVGISWKTCKITDVDTYGPFWSKFNQWHQKQFGEIPEYEIYSNGKGQYECSKRYINAICKYVRNRNFTV